MTIDKTVYRDCNTLESWQRLLDEQYPGPGAHWLDLRGCQLEDEQGLALFQYLFQRPIKFRVIDLGDNYLTDVTAKKIAEVLVKMPSFCATGWLGNMIKVDDNPISIEGLRACFNSIQIMERDPDLILFSHNESISGDDWNNFNKEYLELKQKQDPIIRFFSWLNSFFGW